MKRSGRWAECAKVSERDRWPTLLDGGRWLRGDGAIMLDGGDATPKSLGLHLWSGYSL